jgi:uncharacterized protein YoxC
MKKILYIRIIIFAVALIAALIILSQNWGKPGNSGAAMSNPPATTQNAK